MGIIIFHIMGKAFSYELPIYFYLVGIFFSLLPDIDLFLLKAGIVKLKDHHQFPTHYPLVFLPTICILVFFVTLIQGALHPGFWASVAGFCLLFHYLDDTWGRTSGTGLRWAMPWDSNHYSFCPRRVLTKEQIKDIHLPTPEEWVKHHYLRVTPELLIGIVLFLSAVALVALW